jgi:hypothetical protein
MRAKYKLEPRKTSQKMEMKNMVKYELELYDTWGNTSRFTYTNKDELISKLMRLATVTNVEEINLERR